MVSYLEKKEEKKPNRPRHVSGAGARAGRIAQRQETAGVRLYAPAAYGGGAEVVQRAKLEMVKNKARSVKMQVRKTMKAGNQRGDVIRTSGASREKLALLRGEDIGGLAQWLFGRLVWPGSVMARQFTDAAELIPFVSGALAELLESGNCGEFSHAVYRRLVEGSSNAFHTYACHFTTEDHAFNLVCSSEDTQEQLFQDTAGMAGHLDKIMVVDAWGNIVATLADYIGGTNPYGRAFRLDEIAISHAHKGIDKKVISGELEGELRIKAGEIMSRYDPAHARARTGGALTEPDVPGMYGTIHPVRAPGDPMPGSGEIQSMSVLQVIELLEHRIADRNFVLDALTPVQRIAVMRELRQGNVALYDQCMERYGLAEQHDIRVALGRI